MGTGRVQEMGHYSAATGEGTAIWYLRNPTTPSLRIARTYGSFRLLWGRAHIKTALNLLMLARALDKPVRFFAHATRPGGAGNSRGHSELFFAICNFQKKSP